MSFAATEPARREMRRDVGRRLRSSIHRSSDVSLTAATTHTGFEGLVVKDKNRLALGTFHHQMHHRYFECNYGLLEIPWDKFFGSFHDGTAEANERMKDRRQRIMGS